MTVKTAKSTFRWLAQFLFWTKASGFSRKISIALTCAAFGLVIAVILQILQNTVLYIIDNQIVTMQKATAYLLQSIDKRTK